jgi:hypothetical protein
MGEKMGLAEIRKEVMDLLDVVEEKRHEVETRLYDYRLSLTQLTFKAGRMDRELWRRYEELDQRVDGLLDGSKKAALLLPWNLRKFHEELLAVIEEQEALIAYTERSEEGSSFYDTMEIAKRKKEARQTYRQRQAERIRQAKKSLIQVLCYLRLHEMQGVSVNRNSVYLKPAGALRRWNDKLEEIEILNQTKPESETLASKIEYLNEIIVSSLHTADDVKVVEAQLLELLEIKRELLERGIAVEADEAMEVVTRFFEVEVSRMWEECRFEDIRRRLQDMRQVIQRQVREAASALLVSSGREARARGRQPNIRPQSGPSSKEQNEKQPPSIPDPRLGESLESLQTRLGGETSAKPGQKGTAGPGRQGPERQ